MKTRGLVLLAIFALTAAGVMAQGFGDRNRAGGSGSYNIFVKVLMPDGKPAVGAKISISAADYIGGSGVSDSEGMYTYSNVPAGNYNVNVRIEGLPSESENITIDRGSSSSQSYNVIVHMRNPGQKKGDIYSGLPLFKDVNKAAIEKFQKAAEKLGKDDAKGALPLLDEAIAIHPQFAAAYQEKGSAYLKLNELEKAQAAFVKAIEIKPDYVEAKYSLGYTYYLMKNYEVAAAIFGDVLQQKKDMPEAFMYLGISLAYLKKTDQAEYALKQAIGMKGGENLALAHRSLASIYMQKNKNAEAAAELEKYLSLAPKAPDAEKLKQTIADLKKKG